MTSAPQSKTPDTPILTDQRGPHPDLLKVVRRHRSSVWRKPIPAHTENAMAGLLPWLREYNRPVVLDSFCGTGMSTALLAERHPNCAVIGVDKSAHRLARHRRSTQDNYRLVRTDCEPLWLLLVAAGISLKAHYLLYPNPWPKAAQLKRRIHGHPAFPLLRELGGDIECRSNWGIYIEEFATACAAMGCPGRTLPVTVSAPLTLFERKYSQRGQTLWQFRAPAPA